MKADGLVEPDVFPAIQPMTIHSRVIKSRTQSSGAIQQVEGIHSREKFPSPT